MNRWIVITVIMSFAMKPAVGQTHVQTTTLFQTSTAKTVALSFGSVSTSGNLIVVHLDWDNQAQSISSVNDNKGNTYKRISGPTNWNGVNYAAELWYAYNITGGAITVTAKLSGSPTSFFQIYISEYSGISPIDPLDQSSVAIGNSAAVHTGSKTTTYSNELVYGVSIGASGVLSTGAGFVNRSTANSNIVEDKKAVAVGSYNASFTSASGNWIAQMATFISTGTILPVNLLSFTGYCNNNNIVLDWSTASEVNADFFTIERSDNGSDWNPIGTVQAIGNSSVTQHYSFTADETNSKTSFFRLKQTDPDGKFIYFNIIQVNSCQIASTSTVTIYPNPTNGRTLFGRINLKADQSYSIEVFNNIGKMVSRSSSNEREFTVNFPDQLPSGVYYARFVSATFASTACFLVKH